MILETWFRAERTLSMVKHGLNVGIAGRLLKPVDGQVGFMCASKSFIKEFDLYKAKMGDGQ